MSGDFFSYATQYGLPGFVTIVWAGLFANLYRTYSKERIKRYEIDTKYKTQLEIAKLKLKAKAREATKELKGP